MCNHGFNLPYVTSLDTIFLASWNIASIPNKISHCEIQFNQILIMLVANIAYSLSELPVFSFKSCLVFMYYTVMPERF